MVLHSLHIAPKIDIYISNTSKFGIAKKGWIIKFMVVFMLLLWETKKPRVCMCVCVCMWACVHVRLYVISAF